MAHCPRSEEKSAWLRSSKYPFFFREEVARISSVVDQSLEEKRKRVDGLVRETNEAVDGMEQFLDEVFTISASRFLPLPILTPSTNFVAGDILNVKCETYLN